MAEIALIEGSINPCTDFETGRQYVVPYTEHIARLAKRGYINILARQPIPLSGHVD